MEKQKKIILTGYRNKEVKLYTPKKNKIKLGVLAGLFGISFVVPMMTTVLTVGTGLLSKIKPLWIYQ